MCVLEEIGFCDVFDSGVVYLIFVGCIVGDDGCVCFLCYVVEKVLEIVCCEIMFYSCDGENDLKFLGNCVYFGIVGVVVNMVDVEGCNYCDFIV